jgi:hypothetical protein
MPEPVTTETVVATSTSTETAPLSQREAAYQRLYASEHPEPVVETQTAEPIVTEPVTTAAVSPDFASIIREALAPVIAQISTIEQRTKPAEAAKETPKTWVDYLKEGDTKGFEAALIETVQSAVSQRVTETAKAESLVEFDTRQDLNAFINDIRSKNPDIIEEEPWITSLATAKLQAAQSAGKVTDHASQIKEYKTAVSEAVEEVRKRIQRYRANGKEEAMTTRREVISSSPLAPNQIAERGQTETKPAEPDVSPESYIRKRKALLDAGRGLSN